jgi:hypothetical protein
MPMAYALVAIVAGAVLGWFYFLPRPKLEDQIKKAGGFEVLRSECQSYYDRCQKPDAQDWIGGDLKSLPPAIAALHPEMVASARGDQPPMVHIQLSGQLYHRHGLIVLLSRMTMRFSAEDLPGPARPGTSTWRTKQISEEVYEYLE